jgi:hypothetical protein
MTCNPSKNFLYKDFYKKHKEGKLEPWKKFVQALPTDNKKLPKEYLEHLRRTLSPSEQLRLLHGNWEYDDDPATLIDCDTIVNIFTNEFVRGSGTKYITADVARFGKDKTIIRLWDGLKVILRVELSKKKTTEVAAEIRKIATNYFVPMANVMIDEDGIGGGVVDLLPGCKGFIANSSTINMKAGENYGSLKDQCGFKLQEMITQIWEPDCDPVVQEKLTEELEHLKQKDMDGEGKRRLVSKEYIIGLIGRSPDDLDTYIMRMYFELKKGGLSVATR